MKKIRIKNILKKNTKLLIGLIAGILVATTTTVYGAIKMSSSDVSYDKTTSGLNSSNVQDAIDELKTKANSCGSGGLQVGDYFTLVPDKSTYTIATTLTGYDSNQTITPNELVLWRVININDNGTYDAVSEYVSSTSVYFKGTTGYANFVGGLQTIAAQYAKSGYTVATRMMGYDGQTLTIQDTSAFDGTSTTPPSTTSTSSPLTGTGEEYQGGVLGDTLYLKDYLLVKDVYENDASSSLTVFYGLFTYKQGTTEATPYWLASRKYGLYDSNTYHFEGRNMSSSGYLDAGNYFVNTTFRTYFSTSADWASNQYGNALRPIITLKSDVTISGGHGIKSEPYTFS